MPVSLKKSGKVNYPFLFQGETQVTHCTERAGNEAKPESTIVTPTDLKSSPGFSADLQKEREGERKSEKERDKGRVGEMQVLLSETASAAPSLPV